MSDRHEQGLEAARNAYVAHAPDAVRQAVMAFPSGSDAAMEAAVSAFLSVQPTATVYRDIWGTQKVSGQVAPGSYRWIEQRRTSR